MTASEKKLTLMLTAIEIKLALILTVIKKKTGIAADDSGENDENCR